MENKERELEFKDLKGEIITEIDKTTDSIVFTLKTGERYRMYHSQDCCESVDIEDIAGDLDDLLNSEILLAEEVTTSKEHPKDIKLDYDPESFTWTFYKLSTIKGSVTIRCFGSSNGYYSESVSFGRLSDAGD